MLQHVIKLLTFYNAEIKRQLHSLLENAGETADPDLFYSTTENPRVEKCHFGTNHIDISSKSIKMELIEALFKKVKLNSIFDRESI